jgi:hypothetical protein
MARLTVLPAPSAFTRNHTYESNAIQEKTRSNYLSQFPFKDREFLHEGTFGYPLPGTGYNHMVPFGQTFGYERRPPTHQYVAFVPDYLDFNRVAEQQRYATYWDWMPNDPIDETQCSVAVYLSLQAGGISFQNNGCYTGGTMLPSTFDLYMKRESQSAANQVMQVY